MTIAMMKQPSERRDGVIAVRLSGVEREALQLVADASGSSLSGLLRLAGRAAAGLGPVLSESDSVGLAHLCTTLRAVSQDLQTALRDQRQAGEGIPTSLDEAVDAMSGALATLGEMYVALLIKGQRQVLGEANMRRSA